VVTFQFKQWPVHRLLNIAHPSFVWSVGILDLSEDKAESSTRFRSQSVSGQGRQRKDPGGIREEPEDFLARRSGRRHFLYPERQGQADGGFQQGKEAVVAILGAADFFGEGCLAGQPLLMASASALSECLIMRLEKQSVITMLHRRARLFRVVPALPALPEHSDRGGSGGSAL
jgi:hypothetical protein